MPTPKPSDTVPAMLTPGEAVLNKEAAELVGRDTIAQANQKGLEMRNQVQGYADGTDQVSFNQIGATTNPQIAPSPQNAASLATSEALREGSAQAFQAKTGYKPGSALASGSTAPPVAPASLTGGAQGSGADITKPVEVGVNTPDFSTGSATLGNTKVNKVGTSYSQGSLANMSGVKSAVGSVTQPISTGIMRGMPGITPGATGNNDQAKANMFARTQPIAGMPNNPYNFAKKAQAAPQQEIQNLPETGARIGEQMPSDAELLNMPGEYEVQGYADGTEKVPAPKKVGGVTASVSDFKPTTTEATESALRPADQVAKTGATPGFKNMAAAEKGILADRYRPNFQEVTGPYSKVPPRPTIEAGKNLVPQQTGQVTPVGGAYSDPAGSKPFKINYTLEGQPYTKSSSTALVPQAQRPSSNSAWAHEARGANFGGAGANLRGIVGKAANAAGTYIAKPLGAVGAALGAANTFTQPAGVEIYARNRAAAGDPAAQKVVAEGGVNPLREQYDKPIRDITGGEDRSAAQFGSDIGTGLYDMTKGDADRQVVEASQSPEAIAAFKAQRDAKAPKQPEAAIEKPAQDVPAEPKVDFPAIDFSNPAVEATAGPAQNGDANFGKVVQGNGQTRVELPDSKSYIQSGNQAAMDRVYKGLKERGGIVSPPPKQSEAAQRAGTTDFWLNRGYPGGAQQYMAEQKRKGLEDIALNGGVKGTTNVAEIGATKRRQAAAQGLLEQQDKNTATQQQAALEGKKMDITAENTAAVNKQNALHQAAQDARDQRRLEQGEETLALGNKKEDRETKAAEQAPIKVQYKGEKLEGPRPLIESEKRRIDRTQAAKAWQEKNSQGIMESDDEYRGKMQRFLNANMPPVDPTTGKEIEIRYDDSGNAWMAGPNGKAVPYVAE